jgi:hypothetical protein
MSKKASKAKPGDERPPAREIKGAIVAAHELYMFIEHAIAEAIHCGESVRAELKLPYHVVMQLPKGTYPDANLEIKIQIKWDGSLHGVDNDAQSGKIS